MKYGKKYNVAIVGVTGNVGMQTLQILEERSFPVDNVVAIASDKSAGTQVSFKNQTIKVQSFSNVDSSKIDIAFFCARGSFSRKNAESVANQGCVIIDKTSHFRLNPKVPLIIPEINANSLNKGAPLGIISNPNCVAIPLSMTLKALSEIAPLKRAVVSTYQSVSGAGRKAIDELFNQAKGIISAAKSEPEIFQKQIAYNVIPAIGDISASGQSGEEEKIPSEVCKILKSDVKVAITCVRVPVFIGHCMSVACEFGKEISEEDVYDAFERFDGIVTIDRRDEHGAFATPIDVQGEDSVFVSRIRKDTSVKSGLLYWIASDNLKKGAALNGVQIAEELINKDPQLTIFKKQR